MEISEQLNQELKRGFSKTDLEKLIGLPKNFLSGFLKGKKKLSKKAEIKTANWLASDKPNPLELNTKGTKGIIPTLLKTKLPIWDKGNMNMADVNALVDVLKKEVNPHKGLSEYERRTMEERMNVLKWEIDHVPDKLTISKKAYVHFRQKELFELESKI
jgi:hypothetical protein